MTQTQTPERETTELEKQQTIHKLHFSDSRSLKELETACVDLVVTSPPYPMIEMWDEPFSEMNPQIEQAFAAQNGRLAFELMHEELDKTWREVTRVLKTGGLVCINIGDATRTVNDTFQLFNNHSRIIRTFEGLGFHMLPTILWHKQTNKPNKYMGSGTLPVGAYVTLEHESILIFRKGTPRKFEGTEKTLRQQSAFFWEERNAWFSDVWEDLKGVDQELNHAELRKRSAAFPFELAYRIINMYSIIGDTVLDPYLGTGTTTVAAISSARNSIGYEIDRRLESVIMRRITEAVSTTNEMIGERLKAHEAFLKRRSAQGREVKHKSRRYGFPVISEQEVEIRLLVPERYEKPVDGTVSVHYTEWKDLSSFF